MATETTDILSLPYIMPSQAQKHVTHNEAIAALDALVQTVVADEAAVPPDTPAPGDRLIVAADPSGAFAGQANAIAVYRDGGWAFLAPQAGWTAYDRTRQRVVVFSGDNWEELPPPRALADLQTVGINAAADAGNRLAVASPASLFSHEGSDHRLKVNKAAAADTASLLFQSGYSGRAEMGLAGNDHFTVKVSPDGANWIEALHIDAASGKPSFPQGFTGSREVLLADRTWYVRPDGSDLNDGLSDTPAGAFQTIQKAVDTVAAVDLAGWRATIRVGAGVYTAGAALKELVGGSCVIVGDETTPANVLISLSGNADAFGLVGVFSTWDLRGMKIESSGGATSNGIYATAGVLNFRNIDFGAFPSGPNSRHIFAGGKAFINTTGNYSISGGAGIHWFAEDSAFISTRGRTLTLTGTPGFSIRFAQAGMHGALIVNNMTFTGEATGQRYLVSQQALINTNGGGASYIPGSSAGTAQQQGLYV